MKNYPESLILLILKTIWDNFFEVCAQFLHISQINLKTLILQLITVCFD